MTETAVQESVIEVRDLTRKFRRKQALAGVTITVPRGVVYGLVGENGAGKTTLLKHIMGSLRAQTGSVRVFGRDPVKEPVAVLSQLGYLSEDRDIPGWMRVGEAIGYTQAFYPGWDEAYAESLRERFELDERAKIKTLSRGEKAKCGLLLALAYRPPLLVLDEPSSGLDPSARHDILEAIVRTVADEGRTVLFSSHLLDEVERVADMTAMIHGGRVVFEESLDGIKARHWRLLVSREEENGPAPDLPGLIHATGTGREWTLVCEGTLDALQAEAVAQGLQVLESDQPSLEEVFLARVAPGKKKEMAS